MTAELQFLEAWIPEKMEPGTVFLLEGPNSLGHGGNPFVGPCLKSSGMRHGGPDYTTTVAWL